jgi:cold shock CspA family protein
VRAQYSGRVATFDDHRGRGEVEARGGLRFPFHCTAIADGSRTIAEGTDVQFQLMIGPLGKLEAIAIAPAGRLGPNDGGRMIGAE